MKQKKILSTLLAGTLSLSFAANGDSYTWPSYRSDLDYDTKANIGIINPPTEFNTDCNGVTGKKAGKWWAFYWGANRDSRITDVTIDSILKKYDTDFGYLYDSLGWAPDAQAQDGKYSAIYYYGSGTCAGGAVSDTTGGWQTWVAGYTAVAASFYPLYSFNTSCPYSDRVAQMDAMVHEGIHSMTNGYPGAKEAHWFQEAGNTWIQQDMFSRRNQVYSGMGFLNAATVIAPFMPIECYSGWLIDGTFGGPGAQGVTGKNQRYLLGGAQYSNIFPTFMGTWLGTGSVRWIYGHAYGKTPYLLESYGLDIGLGDAGVRRLITEFRAKLAMLDMKEWSESIRDLLNQQFGQTSYWEQDYWDNKNYSYTWTMTPYQSTTDSSGYLIPTSETTPGWSGANVVPLKVSSGASQVSVTFYPTGSHSNNTNMNFLLAYRATDGTPVYSEPITGEGTAILNLDKIPSTTNGSQMVFAIIVNTEYAYTGNENIRTYHYDYRLKPETGISGAGNANTAYYRNFELDYDWTNLSSSSSGPSYSSSSTSNSSSSSENYSSSSSENYSSSSKVSSSSEASTAATIALNYNVNLKLPIDDNYAAVTFDLKLSEVASALGISASEVATLATYFALEPNGTLNTSSTANAPGHWFNANGEVVEYANENATIYSEFDMTSKVARIGHYPNRVSNGNSYTLTQGFSYNNKLVTYTITITVTNESSSGEGEMTTALMYGLNGVASHLELSHNKGILHVNYTLDRNDNVKVSLFTAYGALVASEIVGYKKAGDHQYNFDLNKMGLPSTTYIVKVSCGSFLEAKPINIHK